jgi:hypothetical protein
LIPYIVIHTSTTSRGVSSASDADIFTASTDVKQKGDRVVRRVSVSMNSIFSSCPRLTHDGRACGKTTFFETHFKPSGYQHVNQDTLKSREKCLQTVRQVLQEGQFGCVIGEPAICLS